MTVVALSFFVTVPQQKSFVIAVMSPKRDEATRRRRGRPCRRPLLLRGGAATKKSFAILVRVTYLFQIPNTEKSTDSLDENTWKGSLDDLVP